LALLIDKDRINTLENWFIVDIGYSSSSESCGIYTSEHNEKNKDGEDISYGKLSERIESFCSNKKEIGLIIEAPLSISFQNKNKNPKGRIPEKVGSATRYWYYGAAATVSLATLELLSKIKDIDTQIYLFEGMVTFKKDKDIKDLFHWEDSKLLFNSLKSITEKSENLFNIDTENYFIGKYLNLPNVKDTDIPPLIKADDKCVRLYN